MDRISTARILADRALGNPCGQECVEWAISMLEQGMDGSSLAMLAGMTAPFNHFELAALRDRALREVNAPALDVRGAVVLYATELLRAALTSDADLESMLGKVKDLCVAVDYPKELYDFYLLYFAYTDLQEAEIQWYWDGGTRGNIVSIIRKRIEEFLEREKVDDGVRE